jgi:hypothetical protein
MQVLSLAWGILALLGFMLAVIPCLGWFNILNIPFAIGGLLFSIFAFATTPAGRRTFSVIAMVLCIIAILIGAKRWALGGFVF